MKKKQEEKKDVDKKDVDIKKLLLAAEGGRLPEDFDQWELADDHGWTVAHQVACAGHLPKSFTQWDMADKDGLTVAHVAAKYGHLPENFDQWELKDKYSVTVAHTAASQGNIPMSFSQWGLANNKGECVLEYMYGENLTKMSAIWKTEKPLCKTDEDWKAFEGVLPKTYTKYNGLSVEVRTETDHTLGCNNTKKKQVEKMDVDIKQLLLAAEEGRLPEDFDQWELADDRGWTVAHQAAYTGRLPKSFTQWGMADKDGRTVAHEAADYRQLPEDFDQWELRDKYGATVAHTAARCGRGSLPEDFSQWALSDNKGECVLKVLKHMYGEDLTKMLAIWKTEKPLCKTDEDWKVFEDVLPKIYAKYNELSSGMEA